MQLYSDRLSHIDTENAFKVGPHIASVEKSGKPVIKLNLGEPDFPLPAYVSNELKKQIDAENTHYCDPQGILPFRQAIAEDLSAHRGIKITPEQVVVFPGGKPPIGLSQQAYLNPGDEVIYPSPSFPIYESFIEVWGAKPVPLHLREENQFSFTPEELEELITPRTKMIFLCFPSNPTGGVATRDQLEGIAAVIQKKCDPNVRVYSDEIYEYITFDDHKHQSIASVDGMQERTIIATGMSKTFSWTGGRVGYAAFPSAEEAAVFKNLNINYFSCVPPYNQAAGIVALTSSEREAAVGKMVSTFQERRDVVVKALCEIDGVSCVNPQGAFYVFPNISGLCENIGAIEAYEGLAPEVREQTSPSTLFQMFALYEFQVAVMDRKSFGRLGAQGKHYLRLSIAADTEQLREGVLRLQRASQAKDAFQQFVRQGKKLF